MFRAARSLRKISISTKMTVIIPAATIIPTTAAEFQGLVTPPHCIARRKQTTAPRSTIVPPISICRIFSCRDACTGLPWSGVEKKTKTKAHARPPMGRLIQKHLKDHYKLFFFVFYIRRTHHLQDTFSVKAPPIKGPATLAIAGLAEMTPCRAAIFLGGALNATIK